MRRLLIFGVPTLLLGLLVGRAVWLKHDAAVSRRLTAWNQQQEEAAVRDRLQRLVTLKGGPMSIADFSALIANESGLRVELDVPSLAITRYPRQRGSEIQVLVPAGTLSLHSALRLTLEPAELCADVRDHGLLITTLDNSLDHTRLQTAVYPLPPTGPSGMDEQAWRDLIDVNLPNLWVPRAPTALTTHVEAVPGALIVVHNPNGHRRVRQILDAISRLGDSPGLPAPLEIPPPPPGTMERQILAALDQPATVEFVEQPLRDVVNHLAQQHGIPLILMVQKLTEASVSPDTPITKNLKDISLRTALSLILKDLELTFVLRNEALLITTPEDAESEEISVVYPVHDLVQTDAGPDFNPLIDLISLHVEPTSWPDGSGPAPLEGIGEGFLLFSQTWHVHQQVANFLEQLRRLLASTQSTTVVFLSPTPAGDQKIRAALEESVAFNLQNTALKDFAFTLQQSLGVPVVLAYRKLEEASVTPDTPLSASLPSAPIKTQLRALLAPLELAYVIRDEVLQITTLEDAESQIDLRLYDIRSLIANGVSPEKLGEQLARDVNPSSWDRVGGPGTASVFRGILVVNQTDPVHEDIEKWLAGLRAKQLGQSSVPENR